MTFSAHVIFNSLLITFNDYSKSLPIRSLKTKQLRSLPVHYLGLDISLEENYLSRKQHHHQVPIPETKRQLQGLKGLVSY